MNNMLELKGDGFVKRIAENCLRDIYRHHRKDDNGEQCEETYPFPFVLEVEMIALPNLEK